MAGRLTTLQALYRANLGILKQKLDLMEVMREEFGRESAKFQYAQVCDVVHASVGQHFRHSMDHIQLAVAASMAVQRTAGPSLSNDNDREIHYDLRERGGSDESDMDEAEARIRRVEQLLLEQATKAEDDGTLQQQAGEISAYFMLSGDGNEFRLPSTIQRELGFAAHHAFHHMAMVKIIAQETLKISPDMLPLDFGKAPSTINYDNTLAADE